MSENIVDVDGNGKLSSLSSERCHGTCLAACVAAIYSASAVYNAIVACLFGLQATAPPAMVITYPLIDFRSESDAQSASQNMLRSRERIPESPPYIRQRRGSRAFQITKINV